MENACGNFSSSLKLSLLVRKNETPLSLTRNRTAHVSDLVLSYEANIRHP
jgi:hypothetical protein